MQDIPLAVIEYVRGIMSGYSCADRMRIMVAHGDDTEYEAIRARGCCAFVDWQKFVWKGVEYWYGFNYGH